VKEVKNMDEQRWCMIKIAERTKMMTLNKTKNTKMMTSCKRYKSTPLVANIKEEIKKGCKK
jgi:hypothetical protein